MAFNLRFVGNEPGAITFTGNVLGLSRSSSVGVPGTTDSIGAFTSIDTSIQYGSYPEGTTDNFNLNSSSAILQMPLESTVLYAELVWGGLYNNTTTDISAFIDKTIQFTTPLGDIHTITPDPVTATSLPFGSGTQIYMRSANVTPIIQNANTGTYTVGGVAATITFPDISSNNCGWTLCVIYQNTNLHFRNLSLYVGGIVVNTNTTVTNTITGFGTPITGAVSGRVSIAAQEGDVNRTGDQVLFGPDVAGLTALSGPNNYVNNFFASQINDDNGLLNLTGTFGNRNNVNGSPGSNVVGGRQGLDITSVDVSSNLVNNQTEAVLQFRTSGDAYMPVAFGITIDINSPVIEISKQVDFPTAVLGQQLTYTFTITNSGTAAADANFVTDTLPLGTVFVTDSVSIDGISVPGVDPVTGIDIGTLPPGILRSISFQVTVVSRPPNDIINNQGRVDFVYQIIGGGPFERGSIPSNEVSTLFLPAEISLTKTVAPDQARPGTVVEYTYLLLNTGAVALNNIQINDQLLGFHQFIASLPPGSGATLTQDYTIPSGTPSGTMIENTVTAHSDEAGPVQAQALLTVLPVYGLQLTKTADRVFVNPGETVVYTLSIQNTSNAPLTNIFVEDSLSGFSTVIPGMNAGEVLSFDTSYIVPIGSLAGSIITNVATAVPEETEAVSDTSSIVVSALSRLIIIKSVTPALAAPGESVMYTINVFNAGNDTLSNVRITDLTLGIDQVYEFLFSGDSLEIYTPFIIPLDAREGEVIRNTATVISDQIGPESAAVDVIIIGQPSITLTKSVSPVQAAQGQSVLYTLVITNTGNTVLTDVTVTDPLLGINISIGTLSASEVRTISIPYTVPLDSGETILNTSTVSGFFNSQLLSDQAEASLFILIPDFTLNKSVSPAEARAGETVVFSYIVTNTGNIPLNDIVVSDSLLSYAVTINILDPGDTASGDISYLIPSSYLGNTTITNTMIAEAQQAGTRQASATVNIIGSPVISLTKSADRSTALPGETIFYTITVSNRGNIHLTNVGVSDTLLDLNEIIPLLGVGQSESFIVSFVIPVGTPSGTIITNISNAVSDETNSTSALARVRVAAIPFVMLLSKTANRSTAGPGDNIVYTITLTNPGTEALTNVTLTDALLNISEFIGTLSPGDIRTFDYDYSVPTNMLVGTFISNTSVANSEETNPVTDTVTIEVLGVRELTLVKAFIPSEGRPGDIVRAQLTLRNTGNTILTNINLRDPMLELEIIIPLLPSGAEGIIEAGFIVPNGSAGTHLINTATATSQEIVVSASASLLIQPIYSASIIKTVNKSTALPEEEVIFTFEIHNLSNETLRDVSFLDPLIGIRHGPESLPAGYHTIFSRPYTIPSGTTGGSVILNTAFIEAPNIGRLESSASIHVDNAPLLLLHKDVIPKFAVPGQTVLFIIEGTNNGNIDLRDIKYSDELVNLEGLITLQEQGSTITAYIFYKVPEVVLPGRNIVNVIEVFSEDIGLLTAKASLTVIAPPLILLKKASRTEAYIDEIYRYTLQVTNTGDFAVHDVIITDLLQKDVQLVPGSVSISGVTQPHVHPEIGIRLGHMESGQSILIAFEVLVVNVPPLGSVINSSLASYRRTGSIQSYQTKSNTVTVKIIEHEE